MKKIICFLVILFVAILSCKKQDATPEVVDQPISISISVDGATSVEAAVR